MLVAALAGLFGLLIGSFLNVCIFRWPRDLSVVRPRSFCPECETPIAWYDNVPLLSFLRLKGRCRHCRKRIPARYPIVEALTALLFFSFVAALGPALPALKFCLLSALLVGMGFSDFEERILPDEFTLGGVLAGLALSWVIPVEDGTVRMLSYFVGTPLAGAPLSLAESAFAAIVPTGFLWLTGEIFFRLRHKEGLGFGDVKMIAAIGAFLGLRGALRTLIVGSILGSVVGLIFIFVTKKDHSSYELPFGSFLAIAALGVMMLDQRVFAWYAGLF
jgi:leader peptidase (prepilin peptidase) / N-methyltransferase